jgi:protein O-mannosyl-transferase
MMPSPQTRRRLFVALLVLATTAAYANAFPPIFAGLDAKESIRDNRYIRDLWPPSHAMSLPLLEDTIAIDPGSKGGTMVRRPVLSVTFALNQAVLGPEPWGYHLVNNAIHLAAALVLFGLLRRTFASVSVARGDAIAFAVALLWAVHPLQTESVTNLVQRAESLMGLLYLLTLYAAARALGSPGSAGPWIALATVASALGMGTKETMVTAPVAVLLYDWVFVSRSAREVLHHWRLHAALFATWLVLGALIFFTAEDAARDFAEGKTIPYILAQPRVILHYLRLAFWPDDLYVYINTRAFAFLPGTTSSAVFWAPALVLAAALVAAAVACWRRHGLGFAGVVFFLILAPTSSVVATSDVLQEHRLYLSLASVLVFVVVALDRLLGERRRLAVVLLVGATLALGARTHQRNQDYHGEFDMVHPPDMPQAVIIVARHEFAHGRIDHALDLFHASLLRFPDDRSRGEAHYELANLLAQHGRAAEAQVHYEQALAQMDFADDSMRAVAHYDIANFLARSGYYGEAQGYYEKSLATWAAMALAHNNLGVLLAQEGDFDGAEHHLRAAIDLDSRHFLATLTLANIYAVTGREAEAAALLDGILAMMPALEAARKARDLVQQRLDDPETPPLTLEPSVRYLPGSLDAYILLDLQVHRNDG